VKRFCLFISLTIALAAAAPAHSAQIRVYHSQSLTHNINLALLHLKHFCELRSQGATRVEITPEGRAGQDESLMQQVQAGIAPAAVVNAQEFCSAIPEFKLLLAPFLFENRRKLSNFLDGSFREEFDALLQKKGLVALAWFEVGPRRWVSPDKPYAEPVDFRGARVYVPDNPVALATVTAMGGTSVAIPFAEVALGQLFLQGGLDVSSSLLQQVAPDINSSFKPVITLSQHEWDLAILIVSETFWNTLTPEERSVLIDGAFEAEFTNRGFTMDQDIDTLYKVQSDGAKLAPLTSDQRQMFLLATQSVYDDLKKELGAPFFDSFMSAVKGEPRKRLPGEISSTDLRN